MVNRDNLSNCVAEGSQTKSIMFIDEYYNKRKDRELEAVVLLAKVYYVKYRKNQESRVFMNNSYYLQNMRKVN